MGIEPTLFAWEAKVLPLNDTRIDMWDCIQESTKLAAYSLPQKTYDMKKMSRIYICLVALFPLLVCAQSCDDIKDKDKASYCRATTNNDKSQCQKIGSSDLLNLCMGKVENDVKYCRRISTDKIKKRCENSIR